MSILLSVSFLKALFFPGESAALSVPHGEAVNSLRAVLSD